MAKYFVGCSGFNYNHWKGSFYPDTLSATKWLTYYSSIFNTVEINATFYRQFGKSTYRKWYEVSLPNFCYSIKMNKYITHIKRCVQVANEISQCINPAVELKEKLGVILIQLPPSLRFDLPLMQEFLSTLPKGHRYTIEARHASWCCDNVFSLLSMHNIAWCISDTAGRYPFYEAITANFIYIRLHGSIKLYASKYTDDEIERWAQKIIEWGKDTYCYFDNDYHAYAPANAFMLTKLLNAMAPRTCIQYK